MKRMSNAEKEQAIMDALQALGNDTSYNELVAALEASGKAQAATYHIDMVRSGKLAASVVAVAPDQPAVYRVRVPGKEVA